MFSEVESINTKSYELILALSGNHSKEILLETAENTYCYKF